MGDLKKYILKFFQVFTQHPVCAANAVLLAAVTGIEQAYEGLVFKCPENVPMNKTYAIVSCFCPAVALWILGILGSNLAWRLCQGRCTREDDTQECACWTWSCCRNLITVLVRASIIPLAWILIVLVDGDMYVCFFWKPDEDEWNKYNKVESQLIGWGYLAVCLLLGLISVFCHRCYSNRTYFPKIYASELKRCERLQLEKRLKKKAEKTAEENTDALMTDFTNISLTDWESICREEAKNKKYFTPLQEFLAKKKPANNTEANTMVLVSVSNE